MINSLKNKDITQNKSTATGKFMFNENTKPVQNVIVVKAASKGSAIMRVADLLRPHIAAMLEGKRNKQGLLVQPAHVRAVALNVAQRLVVENR